MAYRLGKLPARPGAFRLHFSTYFNISRLPTPPKEFGHYAKIKNYGMFANDEFGDCVFAGAAHETMLWHAIANKNFNLFTVDSVLENYSEVTGFDPEDPYSDRGADMQASAEYRVKRGMVDAKGERHKISAYVGIHRGGLDHVELAAYLLGAAAIGIMVPRSAEKQFDAGVPWDIDERLDNTVDGGHYVPFVGRKANGNGVVITWGRTQEVTPRWFQQYNDENCIYLTDDMLASANNADFDELKKDFRTIQQQGEWP